MNVLTQLSNKWINYTELHHIPPCTMEGVSYVEIGKRGIACVHKEGMCEVVFYESVSDGTYSHRIVITALCCYGESINEDKVLEALSYFTEEEFTLFLKLVNKFTISLTDECNHFIACEKIQAAEVAVSVGRLKNLLGNFKEEKPDE